MDLEQALNNRKAERNKEDVGNQEKSIKHPCCGVIPSPDKLEKSYNDPGEDATNTRKDFKVVFSWLETEFPNTFFSKDIRAAVNAGEYLSDGDFESGIRLAFQAFDPIRNTRFNEAEQMVLLYYTGHGLSKEVASQLNRANPNGKSSSPHLEKVNYHEDNSAAQEFLTPNRVVRGGELFLHHVGYCDLESLLQPWIAALKKRSTNAVSDKRDKHLVIIADSCYSGKLVDDLAQMKDRPGPWNENGCTVTVQSASSSVEETFGDYFTPCFVHYNQNQEALEQLIKEWNDNFEFVKNAYRGFDLPSPQLETTGSLPEDADVTTETTQLETTETQLGTTGSPPEDADVTTETTQLETTETQLETTESLPEDADDSPVLTRQFQGFKLRLFRDPGFFKFCYLKHSGALEPPRALNDDTVNAFLGVSDRFNIKDYKLKTKSDGTPLALVLVDNPANTEYVICVHIHFRYRNTGLRNVSGVKLVEHKRPRYLSSLFLVAKETGPKFILKPAVRYEALVRQCKEYVDEKEPGRWEHVARWNMENNQLGVNHMFKMKERSDWMDKYLEEVAQNAAN